MSEGVHSKELSSGSQQAPVHLSYLPKEFRQNLLLGSAAQSRQVVKLPPNGTTSGLGAVSELGLLSVLPSSEVFSPALF